MSTRTNARRAARNLAPKHAVRLVVQRATTGARRAALASVTGRARSARQTAAQGALSTHDQSAAQDVDWSALQRALDRPQAAAGKFTGIREGLEDRIAEEVRVQHRADAVAALKTLSPKMRETMAGHVTATGWSGRPNPAPVRTMAALVTRGLVRPHRETGGPSAPREFTNLGRIVADMIRAEAYPQVTSL